MNLEMNLARCVRTIEESSQGRAYRVLSLQQRLDGCKTRVGLGSGKSEVPCADSWTRGHICRSQKTMLLKLANRRSPTSVLGGLETCDKLPLAVAGVEQGPRNREIGLLELKNHYRFAF